MLKITSSIRYGKFTKTTQDIIRKYIADNEGKTVTFTIKIERPISYAQYGYLYGVVYPILKKGFEDAIGSDFNIEDVDTMMKMKFHFTSFIDVETGEVCKVIDSKKEMNKVELAQFIDKCINFGLTNLGVSFPNSEAQENDGVTIIHNI
jgi:hypothetical protein